MSRKINHDMRNRLSKVSQKGSLNLYATGWAPKKQEYESPPALREDREIDTFPSDERPNRFPSRFTIVFESSDTRRNRVFYHFINTPEVDDSAITDFISYLHGLPDKSRLPQWVRYLESKYRITNIKMLQQGSFIRIDSDVRKKQKLTSH